jgi:hypothetical protein
MKIEKSRNAILRYESIGFGLIILLTWLDELTRLSSYLFGGEPHISDWRDSAMLTLLILAVWAVVFVFTRRLLAHLHHLEAFLRVCAWCRKVGYQDKWVPLEEYFAAGFKVETTHGMCPECFEQMQRDTALSAAGSRPKGVEAMRQPHPSYTA